MFGWRREGEGERGLAGNPILWSLGAFRHAWYLLRTEYTMESIWQDIKYGFRSLNRSRGIISIAILSLAVGIGANTAMFSVVDVFMLKPLPYPEADRLFAMRYANAETGTRRGPLSVPDYLDLKEQSRTMTMAATVSGVFNLSGDFDAERLSGDYVTPGFFQVLGVSPALGRGFNTDEGIPGNERVAIISHELWQRRFGADPEILGTTIVLDGMTHTVVGVMPPRFWYVLPNRDVWAPRAISGEEARDNHLLGVLVRLKDGATPQQALDEANGIWARIGEAHPEASGGNTAILRTLHETVFDEGYKAGSTISMVSVFLVLLIACANVANLLLTHAAGRDREVALRGALGAGRSRIARQFLTEAVMVAGFGGLLGVGLSVYGIRGLAAIMPAEFPRVHEMALSPRVLLFALGITVLTGIIFGLAPALQGSKTDLVGSLKEGGRGVSGSRGGRLRKGLVVSEVALALVLLVSSALLVQAFSRMRMTEMGFDPSDVLAMRMLVPSNHYAEQEALGDFWLQVRDGLQSLPGVETVGAASILPAQGNANTYYVLGDQDYDDRNLRQITNHRYVLPGYFEAMDLPLLQGRGIQDSDREGSPLVAVISQSLARHRWPDTNPIGQRINTGSHVREIVGVVADFRDPGLPDDPGDMVYFCALQYRRQFMEWAMETDVPMETLLEPVRAKVREIDPTIPVDDLMPLSALIDEALAGRTLMVKIMGSVTLIALILALGGIYGIVGYSVSRRTQEMGIRMSLGARRGDVMGMVIRQGAVLTLLGIGVGVVLALVVTRGLSFFLFGVSPFDPLTYAAVSVLLLGAGAVATIIPARRATRVDPVEALRVE
jgi:putative ABC transport system permease protein